MNKIKYWLLVLIAASNIIEMIECQGQLFCFPLCEDTNQCDDITYAGCKGGACRSGSGFTMPGGASDPFYCVKRWYNYYSGDPKWQPSAFSPDIPLGTYGSQYLPNSNITAKSLTISPDTQGTCVDGPVTYTFYKLLGTEMLTVIHPAVTSFMNFWQVKLIYEVITFDEWSTSYKINTLFFSNTSEPLRTENIVQQDQQNLCENNGDKERYLVIIQNYNYAMKTGFQWDLSSTGTATMKWGVLNVIVSIRLCHPHCEVCFGDKKSECTVCAWTLEQAKLSFQTCEKYCLSGWGDNSTNYPICIKCTDPKCLYCLDTPTNCLGCAPSFFLHTTSVGVTICVTDCPEHYYKNSSINATCFQCDANCQNCTGNPTTCITCYPDTYLYQSECHSTCPYETYAHAASQTCQPCNNYCSVCSIAPTNCTVCDRTAPYISYLKFGTQCVVQCGLGYFPDTNYGLGPNVCQACETKCKACEASPTNCSICNDGFYLLNSTCNADCPYPEYFKDNATWTCLDCETFCVNMTMSLRWKSSLKDQIICDMEFTQALNWGPAQIALFIKVTSDDPTIDMTSFNFIYQAASPKIMRLRLSPKGFTFIYNVTFKFKTIALDQANLHYAANGYRFRDTTYEVQDKLQWFLIKAPSLSEAESTVMDSFANISQRIISITTLPYVQEIKKTGVFAMLMAGAQATSTAILVNTIPSQNFYEGVRFWASFVFFDVPPWEQSSSKSKYMVVPSIDNLIQNARLLPQEIQQQDHRIRALFDTQSISWRFQRTGYTSFFVFDTYMNVVMVVVCWVLLAVAHYLIKHKVHQTRLLSMFYSFTIRVHEITIFYLSLTTMLQWLYFEPTSMQRWISLGLCLLFNIYFLVYELYIYYDMINYPLAQIGNKKYDYYVVKYGSLLKHMRFFQYDPYEEWSMKHWFRPYNYHIMSYYKKFLMMVALPIFYSTKDAQVTILIIVQLMEIIRFLVIWPFHSKTRNYIRLALEICLLLFFTSILIQALKLPDIMSGDQILIVPAVNIYYAIGWLGFTMAFVFNIAHIAILVYDTVLGCRKSNRELMDEARKFFYMEKLKQYEEQNKELPLGLVNKWVKLGNLNNRKYDALPDINLRVEYFKIVKNHKGFEIDMKKLFEVFMNIQFNFQKENNIAAGKKLNKRFTLTRNLSPTFYFMIENIYNQYAATMDFEHLTLKTFQKVIQSELEPGQKIALDPLKMQQKIELETAAGQKKTIKLPNLLPGFPLSYEELGQFV